MHLTRHSSHACLPTHSIWALPRPRQIPHIIHEPLNQILILIGPPCKRQLPLLPYLLRTNLDLELMLQRLPLHPLRRPHLRQVDLVREVPVRHAVFISIGHVPGPYTAARIDQVGQLACVLGLEVDADTPVEVRAGGVHVEVGNADLDDSGEFCAGFHVGGYADSGLVLG